MPVLAKVVTKYYFLDYEVDPMFAVEYIEHMLNTEPIGTFSILLTSIGLFLTFSYKMLDIAWDIYKDKQRQGRLSIEVSPEINESENLGIQILVSNTGKEPIVLRELGYLSRKVFGPKFIPLKTVRDKLPKTLHGREIIELSLDVTPTLLADPTPNWFIKDSTGKLWPVPKRQVVRTKKQITRYMKELEQEQGAIQEALATSEESEEVASLEASLPQ